MAIEAKDEDKLVWCTVQRYPDRGLDGFERYQVAAADLRDGEGLSRAVQALDGLSKGALIVLRDLIVDEVDDRGGLLSPRSVAPPPDDPEDARSKQPDPTVKAPAFETRESGWLRMPTKWEWASALLPWAVVVVVFVVLYFRLGFE